MMEDRVKSGAPGQKDLRRALELLGDVEKIISTAGLNLSHKNVQELGDGVSTARGALVRMLDVSPAVESTPTAAGGPPARNMDPMKIALRVLTELADRGQPDSRDLEALIRICGRMPNGVGWDELACEALQKVLADRAAARQTIAGSIIGSR
jgi:hypothetical protein